MDTACDENRKKITIKMQIYHHITMGKEKRKREREYMYAKWRQTQNVLSPTFFGLHPPPTQTLLSFSSLCLSSCASHLLSLFAEKLHICDIHSYTDLLPAYNNIFFFNSQLVYECVCMCRLCIIIRICIHIYSKI